MDSLKAETDLESLEQEVLSSLALEPSSVSPTPPPEVHVEVAVRRGCRMQAAQVEAMVQKWAARQTALEMGSVLRGAALGSLDKVTAALVLCDAGHEPGAVISPINANIIVHVHPLYDTEPSRDVLGDDDEEGAGGPYEVWQLPHADLLGAWEGLMMDGSTKTDCLRLVTASMLTCTGHVAREGRSVLLHGPPGCGKTSLCRALAHKLSVRLCRQFSEAWLVEVDAHSLFSRWFSESGKKVAKLFEQILERTDDQHILTIVLVDEVESLAVARSSSAAGLEPSDSVRAVNALLTGLDKLRRRSNALLLSTSNVTQAVDAAFVDRADIRRLIPTPSPAAAYALLRAIVAPLLAHGDIAASEPLWSLQVLQHCSFMLSEATRASLAIWAMCRIVADRNMSARSLTRLPFLALALHCNDAKPTLLRFVLALLRALKQHLKDEHNLRLAGNARTDI